VKVTPRSSSALRTRTTDWLTDTGDLDYSARCHSTLLRAPRLLRRGEAPAASRGRHPTGSQFATIVCRRKPAAVPAKSSGLYFAPHPTENPCALGKSSGSIEHTGDDVARVARRKMDSEGRVGSSNMRPPRDCPPVSATPETRKNTNITPKRPTATRPDHSISCPARGQLGNTLHSVLSWECPRRPARAGGHIDCRDARSSCGAHNFDHRSVETCSPALMIKTRLWTCCAHRGGLLELGDGDRLVMEKNRSSRLPCDQRLERGRQRHIRPWQ